MPVLTRKRVLIFAALLYLGCVIFSVWMMEQRRASLQFHTRDYNYFIEFAARVADSNLRDRMAMNGDGYNFLGMGGSESALDIFQALHAEYFRYLYAGLYWLFRSPLPLYIVFAAVFFLPLLYAAWLPRPGDKPSYLPVLLLIGLYVLYPATFPSAVGDIRSRFLFAAAWILVMLALAYDRPFREKLACFVLLLIIREEGIVLGGLALVMNFFLTRRAGERVKQTLVLLGLDLLALALFLGFMYWNQYLAFSPGDIPIPLPEDLKLRLFSRRGLALAAAGLGLLALLGRLAYKRRPALVSRGVVGLAYAAALLLSSAPTITELRKWAAEQGSFSGETLLSLAGFLALPTPSLPAYMLLFLLFLLLERALRSNRPRTAWAVWAAGALAALFLAMTLVTLPRDLRLYRAGQIPARLVWEVKAGLDPYASGVLVDYSTWQAFYDFNEVIVYNRLPLWIAHPESRFFPANQPLLAEVMRARIDTAVIALESLEDVRQTARLAGLEVRQIAANARYVALRFTPAADPAP